MSQHKEDPATEEVVIDLNPETVAAAVLTGPQCWDVLNELYKACAYKVMVTHGFTTPVMAQMSVIMTKLSDPEGFRRSFRTLQDDIRNYITRVQATFAKHSGCSGLPREDQWPDIFLISQEYSSLESHFDNVITPLIFSLIEVLKNEYGEILELPNDTNAQETSA